MTAPIAAWIDARESETLAAAWAALGAERHELAWSGAHLTGHGAARLAADLLGWPIERVAWLGLRPHELETGGAPAPSFRTSRNVTLCFLEEAVTVHESCNEYWEIREVRDGARGVQLVTVGWGVEDGSRDGRGSGGTVVRIFDLDAGIAASVFVGSRKVALVSPPDRRDELVARMKRALDLVGENRTFRLPAWTSYDLGTLRTLIAALAAAIDPTFATSAGWPGEKVAEKIVVETRGPRVVVTDWRFAAPTDPAASILVREQLSSPETPQLQSWAHVSVAGLPWGYELELSACAPPVGGHATLMYRLPEAARHALLAMLLTVPGVAIER